MKFFKIFIGILAFGMIDTIYVPLGIWRYTDFGESNYDEFLDIFGERNNCTGQLGSWFPTYMDFKDLGREGVCNRAAKYTECSKTARNTNLSPDFNHIVKILARNNARICKYICENYDKIKLGVSTGTIRCGTLTTIEIDSIMSFYSAEVVSYYVNRMSNKEKPFEKNLRRAGHTSFRNGITARLSNSICTEEAKALRNKFLDLADYS